MSRRPKRTNRRKPNAPRAEAPIQIYNRPLHLKGQEAIAALERHNKPPELFVRSGQIVRFRLDENERPLIEAVKEDILRHCLSQAATFQGKTRWVKISPPTDVVKEVLASGKWPFPPLAAVVQVPIVRPDGTVVYTAGYDEGTSLYYSPPRGFVIKTIPKKPTPEELAAAVALIQEVIHDFPFDSPASRANQIALMLTPILRPAIRGNVPCALIDAYQPGTGKSKLATITALIATGKVAANMAAATNDDEWRKRITSTLYAGSTFVVIDNLEGRLSSGMLSAALTSGTWRDRQLGASFNLELPQLATWAVTGNNIQLGGDMARRCYRIGLDSGVARPWLRSGFTHENLEEWVSEHRSDIVAAALTIARAWYAAGQPRGKSPTLGSFEDWSQVMGGLLGYAGITDFLGNVTEVYEGADDESAEWATFLGAIHKCLGGLPFTAADAVRELEAESILWQVIPEGFDPHEETFTKKLGKAFQNRKGRRYERDGETVKVIEHGTFRGTKQWKTIVEPLDFETQEVSFKAA
jgi:hypothetical protein